MKTLMIALSGLLIALAAACGGGDQPAIPNTEPGPQAEQQAQPAPVKFTTADAVRLVAQVAEHAEAAKTRSGNVQGCDADSELAAASVVEAWVDAEKARDALVVGLAVYLEDAALSELEGAQELIATADSSVHDTGAIVAALGDCGPLTDDEIVALIDEMRDATTEFSLARSGTAGVYPGEACQSRYQRDFERMDRAEAEFAALLERYISGAGSRERLWISAEIGRLSQMRRNHASKMGGAQWVRDAFHQCPKGD